MGAGPASAKPPLAEFSGLTRVARKRFSLTQQRWTDPASNSAKNKQKLDAGRRNFLKTVAGLAALGISVGIVKKVLDAVTKPARELPAAKEAMFYEKLNFGTVRDLLCPHKCIIGGNGVGICGARMNVGGELRTLVYGQPCAANVDPMEKKPFFHFLPATKIFSIATAGCNMRCKFCQNWQISQASPFDTDNIDLPPQAVVDAAKNAGSPSIAYTYTEPTIFYEYMYDASVLARGAGIKNCMHSCGFINPEPLRKLCSVLDAVNIDLKSFSDDFYSEMTSGAKGPVLESLKILKEKQVWTEITNLVIPGSNDSSDDIRTLCEWVYENMGPNCPLHFSRFYPMFKLTSRPPTPVSTLERAYKLAKDAGLNYVYIGNVPGHKYESTNCHACGKLLVERQGYAVLQNNIEGGKCKFCSEKIPGVWA